MIGGWATAEGLEGEALRVSVADRGAGIPPEIMEHTFEPFVTTKAQGMELGLAVCHTIIRAHGGQLSAENNPEGGARFCFTRDSP